MKSFLIQNLKTENGGRSKNKNWRKILAYVFIALAIGTTLSVPIGAASTAFAQAAPSAALTDIQNKQANNPDTSCGLFNITSCAEQAIDFTFRTIGNAVLDIMSLFLYGAGLILNLSISFTITNMQNTVNSMTAITTISGILRNFVNLFFIFILLYTAICTIIGYGNTKPGKTILKIVLVAVFINFSLLMTKVLIDASNIVSIGFYNQIANVGSTVQSYTGTGVSNSGGISGAIMQQLDLQKIYNIAQAGGAGTISKLFTYIAATLGGSVFILITAWVFVTMAILLIIRFIILIILLIFSPVAFFGFLDIPRIKEASDLWWKSLMNQLVFAPAMMIMLWIAINVVAGLQSVDTAFFANNAAAMQNSNTFVSTIFNFLIMITLMIVVLIIAKKAGASGSEFATKWGGKATAGVAASIARRTIGRYGYNRSQDRELQARATQGGLGGMMAKAQLATYKSMGNSSFDVRQSVGKTKLAGLAGLAKLDKADTLGYQKRLEEQTKTQVALSGTLKATDAEEKLVLAATTGARESNTVKEYDRQIAEQKAAVSRLEVIKNSKLPGSPERAIADANYNKAKKEQEELVVSKQNSLKEEIDNLAKTTPKLKAALAIVGAKDDTQWSDISEKEQKEWLASGGTAENWKGKTIYASAREKHANNVEGKVGIAGVRTAIVNKVAPPGSQTVLPITAREKGIRKLQDMIRGASNVAHNKDIANKVRENIKSGKVLKKEGDKETVIKESLEKIAKAMGQKIQPAED
jgi:hypothetical protein